MPLAHERWFDARDLAADWSFAGETKTLALLAAALVLTLIVRVLARIWPGVDVPFLGRMAPWMPFAARMHMAVSLIGLLSMGVYLSPEMDLQADVAGILLGAVMAIVAIGMATGWHTREAALLLIAAGPLGMLEFGYLARHPAPRRPRAHALRPPRRAGALVGRPSSWAARASRPSSTTARAVWALQVLRRRPR